MHVRLGDIAKVRRGASPRPIGDPKYFGGEVGWVRISDVTSSKKYLRQTEQYLSPLGEKLSVRVDKGDLIMSICATLGKPILVDMAACIHDGFVKFYDYKDVDTEYLYYALQNIEAIIQGSGQSGTQKNLNTGIVEDYVLYFPETKREQTKIAKILAIIDQSIDQTESFISKYKRIKSGLMQDLLTKGIDNKGQIRSTKTHKFVIKNGIEVPEEWDVIEINQYVNIIDPHPSHRAPKEDKHGYPFAGIGDITEDGEFLLDKCRKISLEDVLEQNKNFSIESGDIGFGRVATIGKVIQFGDYSFPFSLSPTMAVMKPIDINKQYLYFYLQSRFFQNYLSNLLTGSTRSSLGITILRKLPLIRPDDNEQLRIADTICKISKTINYFKCNSEKFRLIKTGLMQDLLSGKVKVKVKKEDAII